MKKAKDIMTKKIFAVKSNTPVKNICLLIVKNKLSGVQIIDKKNNLIGYVAQIDIVKATTSENFLEKKAKDIMTKKVITVQEDEYIDRISKLFTDKPFKNIPVLKERKIVGIIARKDLINKLLGQYY